mgnify:CR=1 FL=1
MMDDHITVLLLLLSLLLLLAVRGFLHQLLHSIVRQI